MQSLEKYDKQKQVQSGKTYNLSKYSTFQQKSWPKSRILNIYIGRIFPVRSEEEG